MRFSTILGLFLLGLSAPAAEPPSFRNHILPILSKRDCNSGGCHGALAGKGGFRLSLMGYDAEADFYTITRDARGRRTELASPARSLLLTKPTTAVKHKGGRKLDPGSPDYQVIADWITAGAPGPREEDPRLESLSIEPAQVTLKPGQRHRPTVRATYSDGTIEDVTRWTRWTSTDQTVAQIDEETGEVHVLGHGEGAITAWFSSQIVIATVTVPYPNKPPKPPAVDRLRGEGPAVPRYLSPEGPRSFIDELVDTQLERLNLPASPPASDSEFLRRAHLDTIGRLPTPEEVRAFLKDGSTEKRVRLVDSLLERPEFVDYWTYRWADMFLISGAHLRPDALKAYYMWLRDRVAMNMPWDRLVSELVTARGDSLENGATNFYAVHQTPEDMAENVSQAFLSLSINCAKCHNHPLEKWTNDQYYAFANLFARVRAKGWGGDTRNGDGVRTLYVETTGDLLQPRTGDPQPPAPLDGEPLALDNPGDRREALAEWLTAPENPYFTRSIANRVWAAFFAIGLCEPVDDLRISNPPSNPALLDALAGFLVANNYNLRALMREILTSETYARSSTAVAGNEADERFYSRYPSRRLMAEILHDAIADVAAVPSSFTKVALNDGSSQDTKFYPKGTRALELYDSAVRNYFLETFGRNERAITCECERSDEPSMIQVLHLANGSSINDKLAAKGSRVDELLPLGDSELIEEAYLLTVSRPPGKAERERLQKILGGTPEAERRTAVEDLLWSLMTSKEFLFQH